VADLPPPLPLERATLVGTAGKWLSLFGALTAAGQAGTAWLHGYWQAEAEKQKSAQELALAELKDKSELAQQYLKVILDKVRNPPIGRCCSRRWARSRNHPLQKWAQKQYQQYQKDLKRELDASREVSEAEQQVDSAEKEVAITTAGIEEDNAKLELVKDDPEQRQKLQDDRVAKSALLAQQKAKHSITVVKTEETKLIINRSERGLPIPAAANVAEEITSISSKVTVALLESVFPESARKNIEVNAPICRLRCKSSRFSTSALLLLSLRLSLSKRQISSRSQSRPSTQRFTRENRVWATSTRAMASPIEAADTCR
jgi:hypothetical protein